MNTLRSLSTLLSNSFCKGIHVLYVVLLHPRSVDSDAQRKERVLTIILLGVTIILWGLELIRIYQFFFVTSPFEYISLMIVSSITLFFSGLYIAVRAGYFQIVSYLFVSFFFICTVYGGYVWGISMPIGLLSYAVTIVMAGSILGNRFAFFITGLSIISILVIGSHEIMFDIYPIWKQYMIRRNDLVEYSSMLGLIALLSWLANKELERSLHRARSSEAELKQERDNLERTVSERTRALLLAEHERVAQLSHFAEFGKISAGLFHDLINPLTAVSLAVGRLDATASKNRLTNQAKASVERAISATQKMERFMMTIKKNITTREFQELFSVTAEVADVVEMIRFKARRLEVKCIFKPSQEIMLYGNCLKFNQIVSTLLSNALDSYIATNLPKAKRIVRITVREDTGTVVLVVTDYSAGIPYELQSTIFEPFITTKAGGMGLGLSTTKDIVERDFDGEISFVTEASVGTTFTVRIPLQNHE